jgi:hypothetical protein
MINPAALQHNHHVLNASQKQGQWSIFTWFLYGQISRAVVLLDQLCLDLDCDPVSGKDHLHAEWSVGYCNTYLQMFDIDPFICHITTACTRQRAKMISLPRYFRSYTTTTSCTLTPYWGLIFMAGDCYFQPLARYYSHPSSFRKTWRRVRVTTIAVNKQY